MAERTLAEVATPRGLVGGPFGSSLVGRDYSVAGIPVIRGANLGGRHVGDEFVFVTREKFKRDLTRNNAEPGDLVYTQRGTLGQVSIVPPEPYGCYVVSQSQMRLRVDPLRADPWYVYYVCSGSEFKKKISDNAIATGVPHINLGILSRLTIPCPSLSTQRAIVEVLGALDDKVAANEQVVGVATALAVTLAGTASSAATVSDLARHATTQLSPGAFDELVAHYSLPAFDAGNCPEVSARVLVKSNKLLLERPVVLVSKLNPRIPRIWDVTTLPARMAVASTEFVVLEPRVVPTTALWASLAQPSVSATLASHVAGTSGSHQRVRPAEVLALYVPDPRTLGPEILSQIEAIGLSVHHLRGQNERLAATRDQLLPLLVSGRLRIKDAERAVEEVV